MLDYNYTAPINADGYVSALIPIELLWTEDYKFLAKKIENETPEWRVINAAWGNKSLLRLKPHTSLYASLSGDGMNATMYLDWYRSIFSSRGLAPPFSDDALLDNRMNSTAFFESEIERWGAASRSLQISAKYDESRNVFIIDDGHHRATYLRMRGFRRIPALISYEDWRSWLNMPYGYHVNQLIAEQSRSLIYTPVLTPMIHPMKVVRDNQFRSRLDHLMNFLGPQLLHGKLLDIGSNTGFFSFHFLREGMDVVGCELGKEHYNLACRLGDLYRLPHKFFQGRAEDLIERETGFTGCLLLTVLYHLIQNGEHERLLNLINEAVSDFIIWESGNYPEEEKRLIISLTKFKKYTKLATTFATGKTRELGIFSVHDWRQTAAIGQ